MLFWFLLSICILNVLVYIKMHFQMRLIPELSDHVLEPPKKWPSFSLIIPACNEEDTIQTVIIKALEIDYPTYKVIAINDRSTDRTGLILDQLAASYPHLDVVHISTLPKGWLGKLHALHVGTQNADGDYLIYADADVHFHPQFFKKALAYAHHNQLDYLSAIPLFKGKSWLLQALVFAFTSLFLATTRVGSVNQDRKGAFAGVGVFQLIRRSFFEKTPGWTWLKLEIGDDMANALMCHNHGARARFLRATDLLSLTWYPSVSELLKGLEKNSFPVGMRFSIVRTCLVSTVIFLFATSPLWLMYVGEWKIGGSFLITQFLCNLSAPSIGIRWYERIFAPYFSLLLLVAVVRSMWKTLKQKGIIWRGTFYSIEELKEGQRLKW